MSILIKLLNLILYGDFWIAFAATAAVAQTFLFLPNEEIQLPLLLFVFSATLFIYALHRIIGLTKVQPFQDKGRYLIISTFKSHLIIYASVAAVVAFISFWMLHWRVQAALLIPGILSLAYVLPILTKRRRLRDIHFIKIFLIAVVWAWVGVGLPVLQTDSSWNVAMWWMIAERIFFIFAITLPFDIRDLKIDEYGTVKTIPAIIGIKKSKGLSLTALILMLICCWKNVDYGWYSINNFGAFSIAAALSAILIIFSDRDLHDYYFSGLLDGMIVFQFLSLLVL